MEIVTSTSVQVLTGLELQPRDSKWSTGEASLCKLEVRLAQKKHWSSLTFVERRHSCSTSV